jgi:hypothetical protein
MRLKDVGFVHLYEILGLRRRFDSAGAAAVVLPPRLQTLQKWAEMGGILCPTCKFSLRNHKV